MRGASRVILYRIISIIFSLPIALYILWRALKGKEHKTRLQERFARSTAARPQGEVLWIHAVSVGETNSALILVDELLKNLPQTSILFTTTTLTSAAILANKIKDYQGRVIHQFLPIDSYFIVKKFLKFWRPKKVFFVESEIWPNFIYEAYKQGLSTTLVNARMSQKSFSRWLFARKIGFNIFDSFNLILAQSLEDQARLAQLTTQKVLFVGNLKSEAQILKFNERELEKLKIAIGPRHLWLAASTHKGEEEIILATHKKLKQKFPDILTIIVPRHPNRSLEVQGLMRDLKFAARSSQNKITAQTEIYLADTLGELGLFYSLADFAFIGGSLVNIGGHNPFEAIKLNCVVVSGNFTFNFKEIYAELENQKACVIITNENELFLKVVEFLEDKKLLQMHEDSAKKIIENKGNVVQKLAGYLLSS
jgi:3-deoxy-D-manno-octulosonic-acid transferase